VSSHIVKNCELSSVGYRALEACVARGEAMSFDTVGESYFRLAIEALPAAMIFVGADGTIQYANAETRRMFGYGAQELLGRSIDVLVPARLRHIHAALRDGFFTEPSQRPMGVGRDLKATRRDGREFPVEVGLTPIETPGGPVVLATVIDITARREVEASLAQRAAELEKANERLAQFAYIASHDLQEPLRKIAAFSDLLEQAVANGDAEDRDTAMRVIRTSAMRARELVDDLLIYSHMINDAQQLQDVDLRCEIELALEDLSEAINETKAKIEIDVPEATIRVDRSQMARLLLNILSNAIKFRKPERTAWVRILGSRLPNGKLRLAIIDNGIGFDAKYADAIFKPFVRLHTKAQYPGTGIGLAICKSIADRHGWELAIDSRPGEGATFLLTLPTLSLEQGVAADA
jgi:PAS domain S-box-containing protein